MTSHAVEPGASLQVTVARTEEEIERLRPTWEAFQGDVVMTDPTHYQAVLRHNPRAYAPHVVLVERDGEPRALALGMLQNLELACKVGYKTVYRPRARALTVVYRGFLGPDAESDAPVLVDALLAALSTGEADVVYLPNLAMDSPFYRAVTNGQSGRSRLLTPKTHWQLALPDSLDEFIATKPTRSRGRIRRYPKRFLETFDGRYRLEVYRDPDALERLVSDVERVAERTYQRGLGIQFADDPLLLNLTRVAMERGWFRAYVLHVDDEPCAFWMGFGYHGVFRTGLTGYDPAYGEYHVGTFVLMQMLDDLAREDGFHTVDYGFGDAEYKRTFGTDSWLEADVFVFARTARGIWLNLARTSIAGLDRASRSVAGSFGKRAKKLWRRRLQEGGPDAG